MTVTVSDSGILFADGSLQPTALTTGTQTIAGAKTFSSPITVPALPTLSAAQSMVRVNTASGYGSTNTKINRFTTVVTNTGSDITYADSATLGASFTINTSGVYSIVHNRQASAASDIGISLNTTEPTTNIFALTNNNDRLCAVQSGGANAGANAVWTGYLAAGSVIRPHTDGVSDGAAPNRCQFTIVRVS